MLALSDLTAEVKRSLIKSAGQVVPSEIYLTNLETDEEIQLSLVPDEVRLKTSAHFRSWNVVELGEVKLPKGTSLEEVSWRGILPGANILFYPFVKHEAWDDPQELAKDLHRWQESGDKIQLLITQTPFNLNVYIKSFDVTAQGSQGHLTYDIDLIAARDLEVLTVAEADAKRNESAELKRRPRKKSTLGKQIKQVDDIWSIVKILTGKGTLTDVERVLSGNGLKLGDLQPGDMIIWG